MRRRGQDVVRCVDRGEPVIRYQEGALDEVFVQRPRTFHLEQMSDGAWWLRLDLEDGRGVVVWLTTRNERAHITGGAEIDGSGR